MKNKFLALAGCIATITPSVSSANVISESLVGLNLGEIRASSFLNQPFKGVIPLLSSNHSSKKLNVRLAPDTVFKEIGVEKDPVLESLSFNVTKQNNKPVILISSDKPINLPFLNFILEIQGPEGSVYQDYTVLLDPESKPASTLAEIEYINVSQVVNKVSEELNYIDSQKLKYRVKTGDSLSKIAQGHKNGSTSLKIMSQLIHQKNPKAFIRGDVNRIRKGALLNLPSETEINGFTLVNSESNNTKSQNNVIKETKVKKTIQTEAQLKDIAKSDSSSSYKVLKGDSLSKITKKFATKDISFTKLMNSIYTENPSAFNNKSKNSLKAGAVLNIPSIETMQLITEKNKVKTDKKQDVETKQYRIKEGDTLSYIAKNFGYPEVPFAKMLKAIYVNNPNAFIDGKMTKLSVGSTITIPPLNSLEKITSAKSSESKVAINSEIKNAQIAETTTSKNTKATTSDLIKRIRELRKELQQRQKSLSDLKLDFTQKENLLQQKDIKIKSLNSLLTRFERNIAPELLTSGPINKILETELINDENKSISSAELTKIQNDILVKQEATIKQVEEIEELRSSISEPNSLLAGVKRQAYFKSIDTSQLNLSNKNYYYLTMALVLGLLLIRYRRELYSYTYSVINFDQPSYYPLQDVDNYELKEININYHDPKMDQDDSNYVLLPENKDEQEIVIDPTLIEATKENLEGYKYDNPIEEHDQLLSELLDDLKSEVKVEEFEINANDTENREHEAGINNLPFLFKSYEKEGQNEKNIDLKYHGFPDLFEDTEPTKTKREPVDLSCS